MGISKVVLGDEVKLDLTSDSVIASVLLKGYTAHGKDGEPINGGCTFDVDSSGATAAAADILKGKTAGIGGKMTTGTMENRGAVAGQITTLNGKYTIAAGYHNGNGYAEIASSERALIIPDNIKAGVRILGVDGSYSGASVKVQAVKYVIPGFAAKVVTPDAGYDYLASVEVADIPYQEEENDAGGITLYIG